MNSVGNERVCDGFRFEFGLHAKRFGAHSSAALHKALFVITAFFLRLYAHDSTLAPIRQVETLLVI